MREQEKNLARSHSNKFSLAFALSRLQVDVKLLNYTFFASTNIYIIDNRLLQLFWEKIEIKNNLYILVDVANESWGTDQYWL